MLGAFLWYLFGFVSGAGVLAVFGKNNKNFVEWFRNAIIRAYHGLLRLLAKIKAKLSKKKTDDG